MPRKTRRALTIAVSSLLLAASLQSAFAGVREDERARNALRVITDIQAIPENAIPDKLLDEAKAIVIVPDTIKAGLVIGGRRGHGVMAVKLPDGTWSNPSFITLTGGSIGFQAGVQSIDLVMVFTKGSILTSLAKGEFTLGGDIGVAAGPIGRSSSATTDTKLDAEVYSYSRSKGLFAGLTLNGSKLAPDNDGNKAFYKANYTAASIFSKKTGSKLPEVISLKRAVRGFQ